MMLDDLTPDERAEWDRFVRHTREDTIEAMAASAYVTTFVPAADAEPDVQFAVEVGLTLLLDKPLILLAVPGRPIPERLRRAADEIVVLEHDLDTEAGRHEARRRLEAAMRRLDNREGDHA